MYCEHESVDIDVNTLIPNEMGPEMQFLLQYKKCSSSKTRIGRKWMIIYRRTRYTRVTLPRSLNPSAPTNIQCSRKRSSHRIEDFQLVKNWCQAS